MVPYLSNKIILGNDWLMDNKVAIRYQDSKIILNEFELSNSTVQFGKKVSEKIECRKGADDIIYIQVVHCVDECVNAYQELKGEGMGKPFSLLDLKNKHDIRENSFDSRLNNLKENEMPIESLVNEKCDEFIFKHVVLESAKNDLVYKNIIFEKDLIGEYEDETDIRTSLNSFAEGLFINNIGHNNQFIEDLKNISGELTNLS